MKAVTLNLQNGKISVEEMPSPTIGSASILVANHASLISSGTESYIIKMAMKSPIGKSLDRPDLAKMVINKAKNEGFISTAKVVQNLISSPLPLGYATAGEVLEVGHNADLFRPDDRVACAGLGMANHAENVAITKTMACKIPSSIDYEEATFGTLGAIALQGVRVANPQLGETFVVFGLGLIGLLTIQILHAMGVKTIGFDINPQKVELAKKFGMYNGGLISQNNVKQLILSSTGGIGADGIIITASSKSSKLVNLSAEVCREKGRISAVGLVKLNIARRAFFEKEIQLTVSRAYGAGAYDPDYEKKGIDYPYAFVPWTEGRNLAVFIDLVVQKKVDVKSLITHRIPIERASEAYDIVLGKKKEPFIGIVITYPESRTKTKSIKLSETKINPSGNSLNFGIIGPGKFSQGILLPELKNQSGVSIKAIASGNGFTSKHVANKYKCDLATSDYMEIIDRSDIGSVLVATRHNLHGKIVIEAMKKNKNIFVEKPLTINEDELHEIYSRLANYSGVLTVGFNRRHAPLSIKLKELFSTRKQPMIVNFRFITPYIPKGHEVDWVHDQQVGGGRILGEVCHLVDTASYLINEKPLSVFAMTASGNASAIPNYDNLTATIRYEGGSMANLTYVANSDATIPQERIEIYSENSYGLIDNFVAGIFSHNGKKMKLGGRTQHKGWKDEIIGFVQAIKNGKQLIPLQSLLETTQITFLIHKSIETGEIQKLSI